MKNIKIIVATCVVVLSTMLIWTACQKEQTPLNNIEEGVVNDKKTLPSSAKARNFSVESYSLATKENVRADISDNGKGTVVVNMKTIGKLPTSNTKMFIVDVPVIMDNDTAKYTIPSEGTFWLIKMGDDGSSVFGISPEAAGKFVCRCSSTGCTTNSQNSNNGTGCYVVPIPQSGGGIILDCGVSGCDGCCSGLSVHPGIAEPNFDNDDSGEIILKAEKLIINGKVFQ